MKKMQMRKTKPKGKVEKKTETKMKKSLEPK